MIKQVIAIYPGRFQPFGRHHYDAFKWLSDKFGADKTFIATSDKVDPPKSPLSFKDKQSIISKYAIGGNIVMVKNPYKAEEITQQFDPKETALVFMVGEKDMKEDPRFKIGLKKDGTPGYFQKYTDPKNMESFDKHGYLIVAPHVSYDIPGIGEMSGTNIRKALSDPNSTKEQFQGIFGWYDPEIEKMLKQKFSSMKESFSLFLETRAINRLILIEMLREGGKAISNAVEVERDDIPKVISDLKKSMPAELSSGLQTNIGSSGFKVKSGDIDVFLDEDTLLQYYSTDDVKKAKKQLQSHFQEKGLESTLSGRIVHVGIPYQGANAQIDVMIIRDASVVAPWHQHGPRKAYENPKFKGQDIFMLISSIAKSMGYKFDAFGAKLARRDNNEVIARTREEVAKILLNKNASPEDLNSVESILNALKNDPKRDEKLSQAMSDPSLSDYAKELLGSLNESIQLEEGAESRIQHPEDLIYWEGSKGFKKALQTINTVIKNPESVSVKWDGSPGVVFGYDENGDFVFTDKNAFKAKGYEGKTKSAEDLKNMIAARGEKAGKDYTGFASNMAKAFDKAKSATPKRPGYYYGDMLYFDTPPVENGNFTFKPNVVKYDIPVNSELGKKIKNSQVGVVVHYFVDIDGKQESVKDIKFKEEKSGMLVLPPIVSDVTPKIDSSALKNVSSMASSVSAVDKILDKSRLSDQKITDLSDILYNYTNNRITNMDSMSAKDFLSFVSSSPRITETKKKKVSEYVQQNSSDFDKMFDAVKAVANLKNNVISQLDSQSTEVKSSINDKIGGEGYVVDVKGEKIKLVDRSGFTAANVASKS